MTASLYGVQLVRPGYTSPHSGPDVYPDCDWPMRKPRACANYIMDRDVSNSGHPQGSIGVTPNGAEAFVCREKGCEAMPGMPCYFATAEQYMAHWNTFYVAVAPPITCLVRAVGLNFPADPTP